MKQRQDDFRGGVFLTTDTSILSPHQVASSLGITIPTANGKLTHRGGTRDIKTTSTTPVCAAFWQPSNSTASGRFLLWVEDNGTNAALFAYDIDSAVTTTVITYASATLSSLATSRLYAYQLTPFDRYCFLTGGQSLYAVTLSGGTPTAFNFGYGPFSAPPVIGGFAYPGAGNPNGNYTYTATYYWEDFDLETNSAELNAGTVLTVAAPVNQQVQMNVNTADYANSGIPATSCRIYRKKDTDTYFKYVGAIVPTGGVVVFTDNVANGSEGVQIPYDHDPYLGSFATCAAVHGGRLWISGRGRIATFSTTYIWNQLWFSASDNPFYFSRTVVTEQDSLVASEYRYPNEATAGGFLELDSNNTDWILSMAPYGSFLTCGRQKSTYLVQGDDWSTGFNAAKIADTGTTGPNSLDNINGRLFLVGADARVYELRNQNLTVISQTIQDALTGANSPARTELRKACWGYYDDRIFLSIPATTNGKAFALNTTTDFWEEWTSGSMRAGQFINRQALYESYTLANDDPLLIITAASYTKEDGSSYTGWRSLLSPNTTAQTINIVSGRLDMGAPEEQKRIKRVKVYGLSTPSTGDITFTLTAYNRDQAFSADWVLLSSATPVILLETAVCAGLVGEQFTWSITGTANALQVSWVEVEYDVLGRRLY